MSRGKGSPSENLHTLRAYDSNSVWNEDPSTVTTGISSGVRGHGIRGKAGEGAAACWPIHHWRHVGERHGQQPQGGAQRAEKRARRQYRT